MTDDILRRLKEQHHNTNVLDGDLMREAADEIEKLRAALSELVGAASRVNMRTGTEFYTAWRAAYDITKGATIEQSSIVQSPEAAALKETGNDTR